VLALLGLFFALATASRCGQCNKQYAFCCSPASSDKDGDGWGWEKVNAMGSCIIKGSKAANDKCGGKAEVGKTCGGWPVCETASTGQDGWGWEKIGFSTCVVKGSSVATSQNCGGSSGGNSNPNPNPNPSSRGKCPTIAQSTCPCGVRCGCEVVPGLGKRKQQLIKLGSGLDFIASAMMETKTMRTSSYPDGDGKVNGEYCAGLAKQNWFMARQCGGVGWKGLKEEDYYKMRVVNRNLKLDIKIYKKCRKSLSKQKFFAGHRNGYTGFHDAPKTHDINCFIKAFDWTMKRFKKGHTKDDLRFWVDIGAI